MKQYPYQRATASQLKIGSLWWNIHHDVRLEALSEPIENRVRCIRRDKPVCEHEARLRALRPVRGPVSPGLAKARAAWYKAWAAWYKARTPWYKPRAEWDKAWVEFDKARVAFEKAWAKYASEIDRLWAAECADVPYGPSGLLFAKEQP